jgi:hypothetical protein
MTRLSDEMQWIVDQLERGVILHGPVRVATPTSTAPRPWGFADGKRADSRAINDLARRGVIQIHESGAQRQAQLTTVQSRRTEMISRSRISLMAAAIMGLATASPGLIEITPPGDPVPSGPPRPRTARAPKQLARQDHLAEHIASAEAKRQRRAERNKRHRDTSP